MVVCEVTFYPSGLRVSVPAGTTLLQAAYQAGIRLNNICGGDGICGRCKMVVSSGQIKAEVTTKLTREEIKTGFVLACLTTVEGDAIVTIPQETLAHDVKKAGSDAERFSEGHAAFDETCNAAAPLVRKVYLELDKPTLESNQPDHQRVCSEIRKRLKVSSTQTALKIIRALPAILRQHDFKVTATVGIRGSVAELMYLEGGNTEDSNYMAIVDMGTTTVVVHLVNANTHATIGARACFNSQSIYGREVTGRLIAAEKQGNELLQQALVSDINSLVHSLTEENNVKLNDVTAVVCAGNTAMAHFLLALPSQHIRREPYIASSVEPPPLRAAEVGIQINPRGLLYMLPGIGGWVGSDITAGVLATRMHEREEISLLIDIGTNGEVVIGNKDWLMACSASAGPALEGASVECGIRAEAGAIEKVYAENNELRYVTIGQGKPTGICGSGIIDLVAVLLRVGFINRSGKFVAGSSERISVVDGIARFTLASGPETASGKDVYITESDIGNIITAKAAIFAAMQIMIRRLELKQEDIAHFFLAGAFGNYLDIENAVAIGLIPSLPRERVAFVGNTSLSGAKIVALCRDAFDTMIAIEKETIYYDLMGVSDYVDEFRKAMFLPHTDIELFKPSQATTTLVHS